MSQMKWSAGLKDNTLFNFLSYKILFSYLYKSVVCLYIGFSSSSLDIDFMLKMHFFANKWMIV